MSSSRAFASLSATLLARKGGARPAMRSPLQDDGGATLSADPFNDLGWNDMDNPNAPEPGSTALPEAAATEIAPREAQPVVALEPAPAALLARKPVPAQIVPFVRDPASSRPAAVPAPAPRRATLDAGHDPRLVRRSRPAAFTLRVDPDRHYRLRLACALQGRSAQALVTEAVDRLLDAMPDLAPSASAVGTQKFA
ncbi:MAG: hypothetical protein KGL54_06430 [Sphingomonadales bacterium]|nr:hypothetical protein [Sphingomonadales bacterium]